MAESQRDIAERIRGEAERDRNRGDAAGERQAREAADRAERAASVERAREIEREFNRTPRPGRE